MAKKHKHKAKTEKELSEFKPRNKHLNDVLMSRPAGRMRDEDDEPRSREKQKLKNLDWKNYNE